MFRYLHAILTGWFKSTLFIHVLQGDVKTEYVFKVLIIGEISTGKTSILKRYVQGFFTGSYKITVSFP